MSVRAMTSTSRWILRSSTCSDDVMPAPKKLFLTGYTGCGKTSLGRKVAKMLRVEFIDTDSEIEKEENASVSDIFRYEGEEHFRRTERAVIERIAGNGSDAVISTGGGVPVWGDNAERINEIGTTVYIRRSAEQIARRLTPYGRSKRPRLHGLNDIEIVEFMERDIAARAVFYEKAHYTLDGTVCSDEELIKRLIKIFNDGNEQ